MILLLLSAFFAGLLGLAFGSFLNVCASRWPQGESVASPRSHCLHCNHTLSWWENLPLVSWLALDGRCHNCGARIGLRYLVVELAMGVLWAIVAIQTLPALTSPEATAPVIFDAVAFGVVKAALCWLLLCLAVLDAEHFWLPDWLTLGGTVVGLAISVARFTVEWLWRTLPLHWSAEVGMVGRRAHIYDTAVLWLIGLIAFPALILLLRWAYRALRGREGIGLGDAKLMLLLAAWLGLSRTLLAYVLAVVIGGMIGLIILLRPKESAEPRSKIKLPLGTFLCIGGIVAALWGGAIVTAYLTWCGFY